jgi:hypothetical protein
MSSSSDMETWTSWPPARPDGERTRVRDTSSADSKGQPPTPGADLGVHARRGDDASRDRGRAPRAGLNFHTRRPTRGHGSLRAVRSRIVANPAQLLLNQLNAWRNNSPQQNPASVRGLNSSTHEWLQHRIAVRHLDAIGELLDQMDAAGRNTSVFRSASPHGLNWISIPMRVQKTPPPALTHIAIPVPASIWVISTTGTPQMPG